MSTVSGANPAGSILTEKPTFGSQLGKLPNSAAVGTLGGVQPPSPSLLLPRSSEDSPTPGHNLQPSSSDTVANTRMVAGSRQGPLDLSRYVNFISFRFLGCSIQKIAAATWVN